MNPLAFVLGLGFSLAGLFAFIAPHSFFDLLGEHYGVFNAHFVKDAGLAFFSSGTLLLASLWWKHWALPLTLGGALFVLLHGLFHIKMLNSGLSLSTLDWAIEGVVILLPALLTLGLLIARIRAYQSGS